MYGYGFSKVKQMLLEMIKRHYVGTFSHGRLEKFAQSQQTGQPCRADTHIEQIGCTYIQYVSIVDYRQARQLGTADMKGCYIKATRLQVGMGTKYV